MPATVPGLWLNRAGDRAVWRSPTSTTGRRPSPCQRTRRPPEPRQHAGAGRADRRGLWSAWARASAVGRPDRSDTAGPRPAAGFAPPPAHGVGQEHRGRTRPAAPPSRPRRPARHARPARPCPWAAGRSGPDAHNAAPTPTPRLRPTRTSSAATSASDAHCRSHRPVRGGVRTAARTTNTGYGTDSRPWHSADTRALATKGISPTRCRSCPASRTSTGPQRTGSDLHRRSIERSCTRARK